MMRTHCLILASGFFFYAAIYAKAQLTTTVWNPAANPSGNGLWNESANWTGGVVPNSANKVVFNVSGALVCVVTNAASAGQVVVGDGGLGGILIVTNGGSLMASATDWSAIGYDDTGELIIENDGAVSFGNHLWIGLEPSANGTFIMNGGTVSVAGMFGLGWEGGTGTAHINGGTLNLSQWDSINSIKGSSVLDIGVGTVVINGNQITSVSNFISSGKITGYGGTGTVSNIFNGGVNKTMLTATAGSVPPVTNVTSMLTIKLALPNLVLSWPTSSVYYVLQSATNLAVPPVAWKTVTNGVITSNGTNQVIVNMSDQMSFFRLSSGVDASTMNRKLLMGYQGWFSAPGDGSAQNSWVHWFGNNSPTAANANFDFWPDTSELDADELFSTSMTYSNGSTAKLYSAYKQKTVVRHFKWMQDNQLDGVFFQRFLSDLSGNVLALRNQVAVNVRVGAETYGRVFAIMYDISGYSTNTLVAKLTNDWLYLVNTQHVTNSPAYLHHKGKPVVAIWGFGFDGRPDSPQQAQQAIDWFKAAGCTVMGGLPTHWRTLNGDAQTNPAWSNVFRSFDIISPWSVGRYGNSIEVDNFRNNQIVPDLADCTSHGIDYLPVIFPGFSWTNLNNGPFNQIPRNGGNFYWRQAYNAIQSGCTMIYGAMFDEVDEGTAMFKLAPTAAQLPAQGTFVPLNIDGYNLDSDWYLRLANQAGKMLRGEIPVTSTIPIAPP
ncbi:MAG: glycoside hydrolase family 71/99-like protein [Limisphaerales bacterium]